MIKNDDKGSSEKFETYFAPPERLGANELTKQIQLILNDPIVDALLDMVDSYAIIVNQHRQVLAANPEVLDAFEIENSIHLKGLRPGELFHCEHALHAPNGCGTAKECRECGALLSVLESQSINNSSTNEFHLTIEQDGKRKSAEFHVRSTPIVINGEKLTIVVLRDISALKRREILERVFFHDILNTIGGMRAWLEMLKKNKDPQTAAKKIINITERLTQEINEHRILLQAEEGRLILNLENLDAKDLLHSIQETFEGHEVAKGKHLVSFFEDEDTHIKTDRIILIRVIINMVKNAFEAIMPGETVTIAFTRQNGTPQFIVNNPGLIPEKIALHIFERSFSTKASHGRGLGTYSIKLFGEQYLHGTVSFSTTEEQGTNFYITLPNGKA